MKTFIKVVEIWTPDSKKTQLTLADSYFGDYTDFNKQSQSLSFTYNEGLPGTAWAQSKPLIITDLEHSCFLRKEAAKASAINCAIAIPIFSGQFLLAVIVLLCGDETDVAGAIEIWGKHPVRKKELCLIDGYYGSLDKFEWISRRIAFPKGSGLPGTIWDYHLPQIISDISTSTSFLRASNARVDGITTAFGMPFIYHGNEEFIITMLSARGTPIARRFEIWLPDREHKFLSLYSGHSEIPYDVFSYQKIEKGQSLIGQTWLTGCPCISRHPAKRSKTKSSANDEPGSDGLKVSVTIPIIEEGVLTAVVAFTL